MISETLSESELSEQLRVKVWEKLSRFNWMPFEQAREYARALGLNTTVEWREYVKSKLRPYDIPSNPEKVYESDGWISMGDWLGTGRIAARFLEYRDFNLARKFVRRLGLKSSSEWRQYCNSGDKPDDIPTKPYRTYKDNGYISMPDFLGYENPIKEWLNFEEAKSYVQALGIKSLKQWENYCESGEKPKNIPKYASSVYKNKGFVSMPDFLGYQSRFKDWMPFEKAKKIIRKQNLKNNKEFIKFLKDNPNLKIPTNPNTTYKKDGWVSFPDFLGTNYISHQARKDPKNKHLHYKDFKKARDFVRSLNLKNEKEWRLFRKSNKRPINIPSNPERVYENDGWISMGDWLGTGRIANQNREYMPFEQARKYVRSLKLKNSKEWQAYSSSERPANIPSLPNIKYKNNGWISMGDWLGYNIGFSGYSYLSFSEARSFVHKLNLKNQREWKDYVKSNLRPNNIPSNPNRIYKDKGWKGLADWLGK